MPYLETDDGVELFYRDWGTGKPVVLIHGWPVNGEMWEQQATYLAEHGLRVITYDRRGFGRSEHPWGGYDYDTLASDLNAVIEELELDGVTLVGFSMAGGEVVRYLSEYGTERVERAVLLASVTPYLLKTTDNPHGVDPKYFDQMEEQIREDRPTFLKEFALKFFGRTTLKHTVSEAELEHYQIMALTGSPRSTIALMKAWSTTDFREEMKEIRIPVLVIHGTNDGTVPIEISGRLSAALLPNATLSEYEGEPHGLYLTAAERINRELLQFIGGGTEPISDPELA